VAKRDQHFRVGSAEHAQQIREVRSWRQVVIVRRRKYFPGLPAASVDERATGDYMGNACDRY